MNIQLSLPRFLLILAFSSFAMFSGCMAQNLHKPKTKIVTAAGTSFRTNGAKETPATIDNKSGTVSVPVPALSTVTISAATPTEPEKISVSVSSPTILSAVFSSEKIDTGKDFAPPAPPSQNELARASGLKWSLVAGGLFLVAALALVYLQHYKAAGFAAVGAFLVPLAGNFFSNDKVMLICGILVAICCTLVAAWYLITHKSDLFPKAKL